jgi:aminopeptidase-like protein
MRDSLTPGEYRVVVDTDLIDGVMRVSDCILPRTEGDEAEGEVLFSSYTCHPSLANNELSGPVVLAFLYRALAVLPRRRLNYRFVLGPENIGSIAYLSRHGETLRHSLRAGYVLTNIGDARPLTLKRSQRGDTLAERAALAALTGGGIDHRIVPFDPRGADERNYCSPGYDFPVCALMRSYFSESPEYHTSLDTLGFISAQSLQAAVEACLAICQTLEANRIWQSTKPFGEPFFSRHNLAPTLSTPDVSADSQLLARRWLLNQANGARDLITMAERAGLPLALLAEQADVLAQAGLLVCGTDHAAAPR